MGLFSKKNKGYGDSDIDMLVNGVKVDLSNNYKDSALRTLNRLKVMVEEKYAEGKLKRDKYDECRGMILKFEGNLASFKRTY